MLYEQIFKKNKRYVAIPTTPINLRLTNSNIISIVDLSDDKVAIEVFIEDVGTREKLEQVDNDCKNSIIKNNKKWFKNDLNDEDIINKFEHCYDAQTTSMIIIAYKAYLENFDRDKLKEGDPLHFKIKLLGLFINPDSFGNRWMITSIYEDEEEEDRMDGGEDGVDGVDGEDIMSAKEDVYEDWLEEIDDLIDKINQHKTAMDIKMVNNELPFIESRKSKKWNKELDQLRTKLNKFHNFLSSM